MAASYFLTIAGLPLRVLTSSARELTPTRIGKSGRTHDGSLRSTQRAVSKQSWTFEVEPLDTGDIAGLIYAAPDGSFQDCGGAALGFDDDYSTIECQVLYGEKPFEVGETPETFKQTVNVTLIEA